jgi:uncharacterized protein YdcH (DUF465 family)
LVSKFSNSAILVGEKMEKNSANFKNTCKQQNKLSKIEITNLKRKRLFLTSKILKIIIIIQTLNT